MEKKNQFDATIISLGITTPSDIKMAKEWFSTSRFGNDKYEIGDNAMNQIYTIMAEFSTYRVKEYLNNKS